MNTIRKKIFVWALAVLSIVSLFALVACQPQEPLVIKESDTCIVISVTEASIGDCKTLVDYMNMLKADNKLDFAISDGMVSSINGLSNTTDYSNCWMLYTSDKDNANQAWGTVDYNGGIYGSATLGADSLNIKADCLYIWVYKSF